MMSRRTPRAPLFLVPHTNQQLLPGPRPCFQAGDYNKNLLLLELIFQEEPFTPADVIDARNQLWLEGKDPSMFLFTNLMELAVRRKIAAKKEYCAYEVVAEKTGALILGGPSQPDLLLDDSIPIEVKVGSFGPADLTQLQRYMEKYDAAEGVAVGSSLKVELPAGIKFIPLRFDESSMEYFVAEVAGDAYE